MRYTLVNKNTGKIMGAGKLNSREAARNMKRRQKNPLNWRIMDERSGHYVR